MTNANGDRQIALFDLDGTIALIDHRRHHVEGEKKDWDAFFAACDRDVPNVPVIETLRAMAQSGYEIWILSGRSDQVEDETVEWLAQNGIGYDRLIMRPEDDYTPDEELKLGWLEEHGIRDRVIAVFDDRDKVVRMWREQGLSCFQVAPGDF